MGGDHDPHHHRHGCDRVRSTSGEDDTAFAVARVVVADYFAVVPNSERTVIVHCDCCCDCRVVPAVRTTAVGRRREGKPVHPILHWQCGRDHDDLVVAVVIVLDVAACWGLVLLAT